MTTTIFNNKKSPYLCIPLTGRTEEEIMAQVTEVLPAEPDLIEWRADFLTELANTELVLAIVQQIKAKTETPLLFTIRAEHEGGEKISLSEEEKVTLLTDICEKTNADMIDYETSNDEQYVLRVKESAKKNNKNIILSYHNFKETPDNRELMERAKQSERYGADIVKLAVMPESKEDVLRLLHVTTVIDNEVEVPIVTMSMGELGGLSRIIGWAYGSIITFGVGVESSAPGQIAARELKQAIGNTKALLPAWME